MAQKSLNTAFSVKHRVFTDFCGILHNMRRLTTGMRSDKCVLRRFRRYATVIVCTYTHLDSIVYYRPRLYNSLLVLGYKHVQHVTVLNTVGSYNAIIL